MNGADIARVEVPEVRHSARGASGAHRWMNCAGSINLTERLAAEGHNVGGAGVAAAEGTAAHTLFAACLEEGTDAHEYRDMEFVVSHWTFIVDDNMIDAVQIGLDWVRAKLIEYPTAKLYIEKALSSLTHEEAYGTPDVVIHVPNERLIIPDYKHGKGIVVEPSSVQNRYYGYLCMENYLHSFGAVETIELYIIQPRIPHPGGLIRQHIVNPSHVVEWWNEIVLPAIEATHDPQAPLTVGEHCRFCPAKAQCPALKQETYDFAVEVEPTHLTDDELGEMMEKGEAIKKYMESLVPCVERGGYVPFCDHHCPPDVKPEDYLYYLDLKEQMFGMK